jgi:hypothetical protein
MQKRALGFISVASGGTSNWAYVAVSKGLMNVTFLRHHVMPVIVVGTGSR